MRTGSLRHLVTIQRAAGTVDGAGAPSNPTWNTLFQARASIEPSGASEYVQDGATTGVQGMILRMRYRTDIPVRVKDRLLFKSRVLEIESVTNIDEESREMILTCREQVA